MKRILWCLLVWALLAALDLFFADSLDSVEIGGAVFLATCGAGLSLAMTMVGERHYAWTFAPKAVLKPLLALLPEYVTVGRTLVAAIVEGPSRQRGDFVRQDFDEGAQDPRSGTRRALVVIGVSMAPRTFVVRGEQTGELLLHGMPAKAPSPDVRWPI